VKQKSKMPQGPNYKKNKWSELVYDEKLEKWVTYKEKWVSDGHLDDLNKGAARRARREEIIKSKVRDLKKSFAKNARKLEKSPNSIKAGIDSAKASADIPCFYKGRQYKSICLLLVSSLLSGSRYTIDHRTVSKNSRKQFPPQFRDRNYVKYKDDGGELYKAYEANRITKSKKKCGFLCRMKNKFKGGRRLLETSPTSNTDWWKHVRVQKSGKVTFTCKKSQKLCDAITAAGTGKVKRTKLTKDNVVVEIFENEEDKKASFEVKVGNKRINVSDVNGGVNVGSRRRRLLQVGGSGANS